MAPNPSDSARPTVPLDLAERTPVWKVRSEVLHFQFGPLNLGTVAFRALSLLSNPFIVDPSLRAPLEEAMAKHCQAVVRFAMPIGKDFRVFQVEHRVIRYVARYGLRYTVELNGPFESYLKKFSNKSRNTLKRRIKKSVLHDKAPELRQYRSIAEMMAFREIAMAISHRSYKKDIGWGFEESENFARQLQVDASMNLVRGYVLMLDGEPAAYVFCRIEEDVVIYKHLAYDTRFGARSPGTVLLYLMLEQLFQEQEFRLLDFDGMEYYPYKEFFSTRPVRCARVIWFRPTPRNIVLFGGHYVIMSAWHLGAALRDAVRGGRRRWVSARRLARLPG
jgi:CelD/BcsL family acetyltransferase involved in cellulose biosynthesis